RRRRGPRTTESYGGDMSRSGVFLAVLMIAAVACGCGTASDSDDPEANMSDSASGSASPDPASPDPTSTDPASSGAEPDNPSVQRAVDDLASKRGVSADDVEVVRVEDVTWRDGSLGCAEPGKMYTQAL